MDQDDQDELLADMGAVDAFAFRGSSGGKEWGKPFAPLTVTARRATGVHGFQLGPEA